MPYLIWVSMEVILDNVSIILSFGFFNIKGFPTERFDVEAIGSTFGWNYLPELINVIIKVFTSDLNSIFITTFGDFKTFTILR